MASSKQSEIIASSAPGENSSSAGKHIGLADIANSIWPYETQKYEWAKPIVNMRYEKYFKSCVDRYAEPESSINTPNVTETDETILPEPTPEHDEVYNINFIIHLSYVKNYKFYIDQL